MQHHTQVRVPYLPEQRTDPSEGTRPPRKDLGDTHHQPDRDNHLLLLLPFCPLDNHQLLRRRKEEEERPWGPHRPGPLGRTHPGQQLEVKVLQVKVLQEPEAMDLQDPGATRLQVLQVLQQVAG